MVRGQHVGVEQFTSWKTGSRAKRIQEEATTSLSEMPPVTTSSNSVITSYPARA
jgi:hypothetical protein